MAPQRRRGPCSPSLLTTRRPRTHSLDPSSELVQNVYLPLVWTCTVPDAFHTKLLWGVRRTTLCMLRQLRMLMRPRRRVPSLRSPRKLFGTWLMPLLPLYTLQTHPRLLAHRFWRRNGGGLRLRSLRLCPPVSGPE